MNKFKDNSGSKPTLCLHCMIVMHITDITIANIHPMVKISGKLNTVSLTPGNLNQFPK